MNNAHFILSLFEEKRAREKESLQTLHPIIFFMVFREQAEKMQSPGNVAKSSFILVSQIVYINALVAVTGISNFNVQQVSFCVNLQCLL